MPCAHPRPQAPIGPSGARDGTAPGRRGSASRRGRPHERARNARRPATPSRQRPLPGSGRARRGRKHHIDPREVANLPQHLAPLDSDEDRAEYLRPGGGKGWWLDAPDRVELGAPRSAGSSRTREGCGGRSRRQGREARSLEHPRLLVAVGLPPSDSGAGEHTRVHTCSNRKCPFPGMFESVTDANGISWWALYVLLGSEPSGQ